MGVAKKHHSREPDVARCTDAFKIAKEKYERDKAAAAIAERIFREGPWPKRHHA